MVSNSRSKTYCYYDIRCNCLGYKCKRELIKMDSTVTDLIYHYCEQKTKLQIPNNIELIMVYIEYMQCSNFKTLKRKVTKKLVNIQPGIKKKLNKKKL